MKKVFVVLGIVALTMFAAAAAWAVPSDPFISFVEGTNDFVSIGGIDNTTHFNTSAATIDNSVAEAAQIINAQFLGTLTPDLHNAVFMVTPFNEPNSIPWLAHPGFFISDVLTLDTAEQGFFDLQFQSADPFGQLAFLVAQILDTAPPWTLGGSVIDDGSLVNLTAQLLGKSAPFSIYAQSTGAPVPLPGAVMLLGAGLVRLAAYAGRRHQS